MRAISIALAVIGGCALVAAVVIELAVGNVAGVGWVLAGPAPFYVAGLVGVFRGPGHRVAVWLLAAGAMDMLGTCLGDAVTDLPVVASASFAWVVVLAGFCASNATVRSEEHTSELQSRGNVVCRLLLEKKKKEGVGAVPGRKKRRRWKGCGRGRCG